MGDRSTWICILISFPLIFSEKEVQCWRRKCLCHRGLIVVVLSEFRVRVCQRVCCRDELSLFLPRPLSLTKGVPCGIRICPDMPKKRQTDNSKKNQDLSFLCSSQLSLTALPSIILPAPYTSHYLIARSEEHKEKPWPQTQQRRPLWSSPVKMTKP